MPVPGSQLPAPSSRGLRAPTCSLARAQPHWCTLGNDGAHAHSGPRDHPGGANLVRRWADDGSGAGDRQALRHDGACAAAAGARSRVRVLRRRHGAQDPGAARAPGFRVPLFGRPRLVDQRFRRSRRIHLRQRRVAQSGGIRRRGGGGSRPRNRSRPRTPYRPPAGGKRRSSTTPRFSECWRRW